MFNNPLEQMLAQRAGGGKPRGPKAGGPMPPAGGNQPANQALQEAISMWSGGWGRKTPMQGAPTGLPEGGVKLPHDEQGIQPPQNPGLMKPEGDSAYLADLFEKLGMQAPDRTKAPRPMLPEIIP